MPVLLPVNCLRDSFLGLIKEQDQVNKAEFNPSESEGIWRLPSGLTPQSLLQNLGLEGIARSILFSASRSRGSKSDIQVFTLSIPEEQIRISSLESPVSINGKQYLLDKDFEGFTPLCPAPILEDFVEYITFSDLRTISG
ncbi:uncharacterized protein KY384_006660 [Bacidia gigantensis]|uniref:uncharacterized protein n=1 Tax=Bacidia gigantensis TaxID=2732470 RepID=UPI001D058E8F|nr:uncharacterized protein KY384_006660 [Bacidia gigantensis]KAG8528971.1 hypothetical protein KY384_006660 [Bacidia gigantensis]